MIKRGFIQTSVHVYQSTHFERKSSPRRLMYIQTSTFGSQSRHVSYSLDDSLTSCFRAKWSRFDATEGIL